jgi:hypothetical protein
MQKEWAEAGVEYEEKSVDEIIHKKILKSCNELTQALKYVKQMEWDWKNIVRKQILEAVFIGSHIRFDC